LTKKISKPLSGATFQSRLFFVFSFELRYVNQCAVAALSTSLHSARDGTLQSSIT
jgi:hypothetical protein